MSSSSEHSGAKPFPLGRRIGEGAFFNSKLLLFGEYGLMFEAMALSVPFDRFFGKLDFDKNRIHQESTAEIFKFQEHLKKGESYQKLHFVFDLEALHHDLQEGLYFKSNIPQQYGVGSSGALVAALFDRYVASSDPENKYNPELLKTDFALLESYFHGRSSGIDPLISYLNRPILLDSKKQINLIDFELRKSGLKIALIDTKITGATGPLVQYFINRFNSPRFERAFETQFIPANNTCIESILNGEKSTFFNSLEQLIRFELIHFQRMITGNFQSVIEEALNEKVFIKLLGSGGGGFLLAFCESEDILKGWSEKWNIELEIV